MTIDTKELRVSAANSVKDLALLPSEVLELLDRLEAAEKEGDTMRTKISDLTINAEYLGNLKKSYEELIGELQDERDNLRAKIEAMERQEPSEQDASVRKAWARFSHELHRSPDAPYPGMSEAFEQHFSQSFTDRDWRVESGVWAAAWKAAKRHGAKGE